MKEGAPDIPLRAPTLLSMSAAALAKRHTDLMLLNSEADAVTEVYADCPLPSGASHAVFDEHRKMWNSFNEAATRPVDNTLKAFFNSSNFRLDNLNLTGATLNDEILTELLTQHYRISQLDLTDVKVSFVYPKQLCNQKLKKDNLFFAGNHGPSQCSSRQ